VNQQEPHRARLKSGELTDEGSRQAPSARIAHHKMESNALKDGKMTNAEKTA